MTKLAIVQKAPVFLDKEKTIAKAVESVHDASANNADLVVFTEAFIPGYPTRSEAPDPGGIAGDEGLGEDDQISIFCCSLANRFNRFGDGFSFIQKNGGFLNDG